MSTEERTDFRKCGPDVLYETRKIVIKMWKSKVPVEEIGRITGLTTKTIYDKIRLYKEGGMTALKPKTRGRKSGEKRTLKPAQEKEIIKIITDKNPDQLKFKCCLWTREVLKQLIKEKYGIDMPIRTVGQYLQRWGFTVQRPAKQAMNQKPEAVQTWLHEQYPSIHEEAKKSGERTLTQRVEELEHELAYAQQEVEFLKKIHTADLEARKQWEYKQRRK